MAYIFYDFETSSRDFLGQILSYAFIVTDADLSIQTELTGQIKLNRTQLPEIDAILINRLNLDELQEQGQTEYEAAIDIYNFLSQQLQVYRGATLVGYNSNQFDLNFLRNLLIQYGFNPYFKGKLQNIDCLHYSQYLAFQFPEQFPWVRIEKENTHYYSFRLEDLSHSFGLLQTEQSHNAKEDVLLTISLCQVLAKQYEFPLVQFNPIHFDTPSSSDSPLDVGKYKTRHFPDSIDTPLLHYNYTHIAKLGAIGKACLTLNLDRLYTLTQTQETLSQDDYISCLRYINPNKHFLHLEPCTSEDPDYLISMAKSILDIPIYASLYQNPHSY